MTYLNPTLPTPFHNVVLRCVQNFFEKRRAMVTQRKTVYALSALDNRALQDLAISRSEIYSVTYCAPGERRRSGSR